jgi:hypothetical protein
LSVEALAPGVIGRTSVMRAAANSITYRKPVLGSSVRSSGSTKCVSPAMPVWRLTMFPLASGVSTAISSPPLYSATSNLPLSNPPNELLLYSMMPSGE